jgi:hydrogenase expression/formation protein HypE
MTTLPTGKLPAHLLREFLANLPSDDSVVVGPGIGRDAAAIRVGDQVLVLKTDPITFATDEIGWYVVNINANDIACMGADPRWLLVTALLPESATTPELVETIFRDIQRGAERVGCTLVGGHTEITEGLDRPILVGNMIGVAPECGIIDPTTAEPGDAILLVGGIAIEGTALLATELSDHLPRELSDDILHRARDFLHDPGISVVEYARKLRRELGGELKLLHDPTEGGLATGLYEIAEATGLGLDVNENAIYVYPETRRLCDAFGVNPLGLIASGALLAVTRRELVPRAVEAFADSPIDIRCIGVLTPDPAERTMRLNGQAGNIPEFEVDEIARLFSAYSV